jgi:hypothetical protein
MCSNRKVIAVVWAVVWALSGSWAQSSKPAAQNTPAEHSPRVSDDEKIPTSLRAKGTVSLIGVPSEAGSDPRSDRAAGIWCREVNLSRRSHRSSARSAVSTRESPTRTRIYADTTLLNGRIFAKTIRIDPKTAPGEANGQCYGLTQTHARN